MQQFSDDLETSWSDASGEIKIEFLFNRSITEEKKGDLKAWGEVKLKFLGDGGGEEGTS